MPSLRDARSCCRIEGDPEAVCVDGRILRVFPLFLTFFLPFTRRVSPRLGVKRQPKPTARLFLAGATLAKVPLAVLTFIYMDLDMLLGESKPSISSMIMRSGRRPLWSAK